MFYLSSIIIIIFTFYLVIKSLIYKSEPFDKDNTLTIRGLAILCIIMHHTSQYFQVYGIVPTLFELTGFIFTGIFFALSGYGNYLSYEKNNDIGKRITLKWIVKRILRLYISCFIAIIISNIAILIFKDLGHFSINELIKDIFTLTLPIWINWYLKVQLFLYVAFFIVFRYVKHNKNLIFSAVVLCFVILLYLMKFEVYWYNSCLCFCIGILFAKYKDNYLNLSIIKKIAIILFVGIGTGIALMYDGGPSSIFVCMGIVTIILLVDIITPIKSTIMCILGECSLEIYLFHWIFICIFRVINFNENIEILAILIISCIGSIILNKLVKVCEDNIMNIFFNNKCKNDFL